MTMQHGSAVPTARPDILALARLRGRWPLLTRGLWLALLALTLAIAAASLPAYLAQLQTPCVAVACEYQQLSSGQVEALAGMGLSLRGYAALTVALLLAGLVVCWAVSALIVWRRPDDRMALLVALLLVPWGPLGVATARAGEAPTLLFAEIDPARIAHARSVLPVLANRRFARPELAQPAQSETQAA